MPKAGKPGALFGIVLLALLAGGCVPVEVHDVPEEASPIPSITPLSLTVSAPTPSIQAPTQSSLAPREPEGCHRPSEDYGRVEVNGLVLNARTREMLEYAASLYAGPSGITGDDLTQGSYTSSVAASGGTHAGGGAVDLSVIDTSGERWRVQEEEIPALIGALRLAGFAAWYRAPDDVEPGSPPHIHAIAIGDRDLSEQALGQLDGACGYFSGYVGLPIQLAECAAASSPPVDTFGGPLVCGWMCDLAYEGLAGNALCEEWGASN
jgi:hypothetical protein